MKIREGRPINAGKQATPRIGLLRLERLAGILENAHKVYKKLSDCQTQLDEKYSGERAQITAYSQDRFEHPCGTPACALGHYAFHTPARWGWSEAGGLTVAEEFGFNEFAQAMHEFHLGDFECNELFGHAGCGDARTAGEAAKYIRKFVARKRKELGLKKPVRK